MQDTKDPNIAKDSGFSDPYGDMSTKLTLAKHMCDRSVSMLESKLRHMSTLIDNTVIELERHGAHADLGGLGSMHDQGAAVDRLKGIMDQQREHLDRVRFHLDQLNRVT
jgi:hypothetical protein